MNGPDRTAPPGYEVPLSLSERSIAEVVAETRHGESVRDNRRPSWGEPTGDEHSRHRLGALGEVAGHSFLDTYYGGTVGTFHDGGDVRGGIEIRTTASTTRADLVIHDYDVPDRPYLLVRADPTWRDFVVLGWAMGTDCQRPEWRRRLTADRDPVYAAPRSSLRDARELRGILAKRRAERFTP